MVVKGALAYVDKALKGFQDLAAADRITPGTVPSRGFSGTSMAFMLEAG